MRLLKPLLLSLALGPSLAFAQMAQASTYDDSSSPFRVVFGLLIVLGVIAAFAWIMKRFNNSRIGGHSVAKIVGGVNLGSRERLVVVELAGHWIVTGVTPGNINSLGSFKISEMEHLNSSTKAVAADKQILLEQSQNQNALQEDQQEVSDEEKSESSYISKNDRFRFQSRPVIDEVQSGNRVAAMANPALTQIFKRLLNK